MAALKLQQLVDTDAARFGRAVLRTYAAVLFSRSLVVGLLLFCATAVVPTALIGGLLAVSLALGTAWLLDLDREAIQDGSYGVSALLLGLGISQTLGLGKGPLILLLGTHPAVRTA
jgi:urea transporter